MSNLKWKDKLFSSSLPLEFEAAKILEEKGFIIRHDYTYKRFDNKDEKDFSIDIHADCFYPFEEEARIHQSVEILVECKYRNPNIQWLFLPDINTNEYHQVTSRGALKFVDEFSNVSFWDNIDLLDEHPMCLKGVEINKHSGDVHDEGILHGTYQLLYGIPVLLSDRIFSALRGSIEEVYPFVICPILLTTAELYVVNNDFGLDSLGKSEAVENFSYKVQCLRYCVTIPPSFNFHSQNVIQKVFRYENYHANYDYFLNLRKNSAEQIGKGIFQREPELFMNSLLNGLEKEFFQEVLICSISYFPALIDRIKENIEYVDKHKTLLPRNS